MARIIIGSSNIYRYYKPDLFTGCARYKMVACTNMEVFKVALDELDDVKGGVAISVIENFLCKAVRGTKTTEERSTAVKEAIGEYLKVIQERAIKLAGKKFALVHPILRPGETWYTESHDQICKQIEDGIRIMDLQNVSRIYPFPELTQVFEQDGVHLTPTSGKVFLEAVLFNAEEYFEAEFVDLEMEVEVAGSSGAGTLTLAKEKGNQDMGVAMRVTMVEKEIKRLTDDLRERRIQDSMVMSRIREEMDFESRPFYINRFFS